MTVSQLFLEFECFVAASITATISPWRGDSRFVEFSLRPRRPVLVGGNFSLHCVLYLSEQPTVIALVRNGRTLSNTTGWRSIHTVYDVSLWDEGRYSCVINQQLVLTLDVNVECEQNSLSLRCHFGTIVFLQCRHKLTASVSSMTTSSIVTIEI